MTSLQAWLSKPRTTVRIDTSSPWATWISALRRPFANKQAVDRPHIEVLDRLSLGGKRSLLLVSIEGRRLLVGVGEEAAPSIAALDGLGSLARARTARHAGEQRRGRRIAR